MRRWSLDALEGTRVVTVPLEAEDALEAATLHAVHADPFDRFIVGAALRTGAQLVTADAKIAELAAGAGFGCWRRGACPLSPDGAASVSAGPRDTLVAWTDRKSVV